MSPRWNFISDSYDNRSDSSEIIKEFFTPKKCSLCGEESRKGRFWSKKFICAKCITSNTASKECFCSVCNLSSSVFKIIEIKKKYFCKKCATINHFFCGNCSSWFPKEMAKKAMESTSLYCKTCYSKIYQECVICGNLVNVLRTTKGANNKVYCSDCWKERFDFCTSCNYSFWKSDLRTNPENDRLYCNVCWSSMSVIHDYSYSPRPKFLKLNEQDENKERKNLYMGFELEVCHKQTAEKMGRKLKKLFEELKICDKYYLKYDSSIVGFEIVSHPFTLEYGIKNMRIMEMLEWLQDNGFYSNSNNNCGLHVHFNRSFFASFDDKIKIRMFISRYKKKIFKLSGRKDINNEYCVYERYNLEKFMKDSKQKGRHWALNMNTSKNTMELRVFVGTLNFEEFMGALEFVHSLSLFLKKKNLNLVSNGKLSKRLWNKFINFIQIREEYKNIYSLMRKKELCV